MMAVGQLCQEEQQCITDICQLWYTTALFGPVKITPKLAKMDQNGPKFRVLFAKKHTGLKKVHHRRLWRLWQISAMQQRFLFYDADIVDEATSSDSQLKPSLNWLGAVWCHSQGHPQQMSSSMSLFYYGLYQECCLWWSKMTMTMKVTPIKSKIVTTGFMFTTLSSSLTSQEKARVG